MKKWKCLVCGQIVESETAPEACPLCKAPAEKFVEVKDEELLFKLINENFTKRRKTIMNSLSNSVEKERLAEILKELDISEQARGENLTLEQFAKIADRI